MYTIEQDVNRYLAIGEDPETVLTKCDARRWWHDVGMAVLEEDESSLRRILQAMSTTDTEELENQLVDITLCVMCNGPEFPNRSYSAFANGFFAARDGFGTAFDVPDGGRGESGSVADRTAQYEDNLRFLIQNGDAFGFNIDIALFIAVLWRNTVAEAILRQFRPDGFSVRFRNVLTGQVDLAELTRSESIFINWWRHLLSFLAVEYSKLDPNDKRFPHIRKDPDFGHTISTLSSMAGGPLPGIVGRHVRKRSLLGMDLWSDELLCTLMRNTRFISTYGKEQLLKLLVSTKRLEPLITALSLEPIRSRDVYERVVRYASEEDAGPHIMAATLSNGGQTVDSDSELRMHEDALFEQGAEVEAKLRNSWVTRELDDGTLMVTGYRGLTDEPEEIAVPARIGNRKVTQLHAALLYGWTVGTDQSVSACCSVRSLRVPGTIRKIPAKCLGGHKEIERVILEEGVEEVGDDAFSFCRNLTDVELPSTVWRIGPSAGLFSPVHDKLRGFLSARV